MYTEPLVVHVGCDAIILRRKNILNEKKTFL